MGLGIVLAGISIFNILALNAAKGSVWNWKPAPLVCDAALLIIVFWAQAAVKRRITYRRTGYVKYRHSRLKAIVAGSVAAIIAMITVFTLQRFWHVQSTAVLLAGLSMCALYVYATKMDRPWRWIVAVVMVIGPLIIYSLLANDPGAWRSTGIISVCWLASGGITFWLYLRNTRPAESAR